MRKCSYFRANECIFALNYGQVARKSSRPKFHNAQKDSKNASQSEMWNCETQVVHFAVVFMEIVNLKENTKLKKNLVISVTVGFLLLFLYVEASCFERRSTSLRLERWKRPPSWLQHLIKNHHMIAKQDCDVAVNSDTHLLNNTNIFIASN